MNLQSLHKFVINLPSRTDRRKHILNELHGWNYTFVSGYIKDTAMLGIAQAHIDCVFKAQFLNMPYVLIMEDDVVLRKGAEEYLNKALQNLPNNWDILLGGLYETKTLSPVNEYWSSVNEFCGLHFYIVNAKAYDYILAYNKEQHIDRYMNRHGKGLKTFVLNKFIATQLPGKSDNTKSIENYEHKLKRFNLL